MKREVGREGHVGERAPSHVQLLFVVVSKRTSEGKKAREKSNLVREEKSIKQPGTPKT